MSSVTTSEELQKLLSIIFGYIGERTEIPAGDVVGPSKATKTLVNNLTERVLNFLRAYNGMLRDYAGAEIYGIEFELKDFQERETKTRLYPKSMLFIPGKYKENQSLVIALKHEIGILNPDKARAAMDRICELYDEIEEIVDRPTLNAEQKKLLLTSFAQRYSRKVQGKLIEGKWDRKLVGLQEKESSENTKEHQICSIQMERDITWIPATPEIVPKNPRYRNTRLPLNNEGKLEHFKFAISPPGAYFIAQNTFKLASNLLEIANTGSVNEIQQKLISLMLWQILREIGKEKIPQPPEWVVDEFESQLKRFQVIIDEFVQIGQAFTLKGEMGSFDEIFIALVKHYGDQESPNKSLLRKILDIFIDWSKETSIDVNRKMRTSELRTDLDYFNEIVKLSLHIVEQQITTYLAKVIQGGLNAGFLDILRDQFHSESKSTKALGFKFINKLEKYLEELLEKKYIFLERKPDFEIAALEEDYYQLVKDNLDEFLDGIPITIRDLLGFAEDLVEENTDPMKGHLERFQAYETEMTVMQNFITRYSTLNRFVREFSDEFFDPESFISRFREFVRKRIGGLMLKWTDYGLAWLTSFQEIYQPLFEKDLDEGTQWESSRIIELFLSHIQGIGEKIKDAQEFVQVLDHYVGNMAPRPEKPLLINFVGQFEETLGITKAFPEYIKKIILKMVEGRTFRFLPQTPSDYFIEDETNSFMEFLLKHHLRYYSKLLAEPKTLLLKNYDYDVEGEEDLMFRMDFSYQKNRMKAIMTSNWFQIRNLFR